MRRPRGRAIAFAAAAVLAATVAPVPARAQGASASAADLRGCARPDAAAWMSGAGRAAWTLAEDFAPGMPPAVAGLAHGGWRLFDDSRAPEGGPFPGLPEARPPLAAYDSLSVRPATGAATGPGGELVRVRPEGRALVGRDRPLAVFALTNGDYARDETSLTAERGGAAGGLRLETLAARRGGAGPYGLAGRHRWGATLDRVLGTHTIRGSFRQAGVASRLRSNEEQAARGASGRLAWRRSVPGLETSLAVSRQWDAHESFGGTFLTISRRDAQEARVEGAAIVRLDSRSAGLRVDWHRLLVRRDGTSPARTYAGDDWGGLFAADERAGRRLRAELDAGRIGAIDRIELAPGLSAEWSSGARRIEWWARRLLEPVSHDLAAGESPFLQSTWASGAGIAWTGARHRAGLHLLGGTTRDRALIARRPLEEQWLREGVRRDRERWTFGQVWSEVRTGSGPWSAGGEASATLRDRDGAQARVDPAVTGHLFGEWEGATFGGDLRLTLRLEADAVGSRVTDEPTPRELPAFVTSHALVGLGVGDARVTLRMRHLENGVYENVWIDPVTGRPARDPRRELRVAVVWTLRN